MELLKAGLSYGHYLAKHANRVDQALAYANAESEARKARVGLWPYWLGDVRPPAKAETSPRANPLKAAAP